MIGKQKAYAAAAMGFLAPGAAYLIGVAADGITGNEWIVGGLTCLAASAATGGVVWAVENKKAAS